MSKKGIKIENHGALAPTSQISLCCPICQNYGSFNNFKNVNDVTVSSSETLLLLGQRYCPNSQCLSQLFFVQQDGRILYTYPPQTIDFDSKKIPEKIVESLQEAIICHANQCFIAAAIMVRKALEEFCKDCGATGNNLKNRILDLKSKIILPQELIDGIDDLRLLGNDAAHLESQVFNKIGKEEIEISIEFTKEVLKAKYQLSSLLEKLQNLKNSSN